jgi:hypothetical protein
MACVFRRFMILLLAAQYLRGLWYLFIKKSYWGFIYGIEDYSYNYPTYQRSLFNSHGIVPERVKAGTRYDIRCRGIVCLKDKSKGH